MADSASVSKDESTNAARLLKDKDDVDEEEGDSSAGPPLTTNTNNYNNGASGKRNARHAKNNSSSSSRSGGQLEINLESRENRPAAAQNRQQHADKYLKLRTVDSKTTYSYGAGGGASAAAAGTGVISEHYKSIANAITLSSLDTLNDIDSEDDDDDDDEDDDDDDMEETENIFAIHNEILESNNIDMDDTTNERAKLLRLMDEDRGNASTSAGDRSSGDQLNDEIYDNDEEPELYDAAEVRRNAPRQQNRRHSNANEADENYDDYIEDSEFIKHISKGLQYQQQQQQQQRRRQTTPQQHTDNEDESLDQFNPSSEYYRNNSYYNYNIHGINTNVSMNPVTSSGGSGADNKFMFAPDQDWSYSQNSTLAHNLTASDQKLVNEIVRKLKPYIYKSIRKEVRLYFERNLAQMNQY
jgi:hypothetical protein